MTVAEYLQSEEAVHDVAALLEAKRAHARLEVHPGIRVLRREGQAHGWGHGYVGPWQRVSFGGARYPQEKHVYAYYRPEGDRYIVTDLGEAVRALRLRTGVMDPEIVLPTWASEGYCVPYVCANYWPVLAMADAHGVGVSAADLPRAIVRVMLAAHRVAALVPT